MNDFSSKCEILGELWIDFKDDENLKDFIEYNDLGLPLAYCISQELATGTPQGELYVNETWDLLVEALGLDSEREWESLDEMMDNALVQDEDEE